MNTDIAFDKVKMRMIQKTAYRIAANIQTVNSYNDLAQQAFCQMVANKAIHPEDEYPGTASGGAGIGYSSVNLAPCPASALIASPA